MKRIARVAACLSFLGLSACFYSEQPLIAEAESEYPLPEGAYLAHEPDASDEPDRYTVTYSGPDTLALEAGEDEPSVLRFRHLDGPVYVMQSAEEDVYWYGALRTQDGGADIWISQCSELTDADRKQLGLVMQNDECHFRDWETLARATALVVERRPPGLVFTRTGGSGDLK